MDGLHSGRALYRFDADEAPSAESDEADSAPPPLDGGYGFGSVISVLDAYEEPSDLFFGRGRGDMYAGGTAGGAAASDVADVLPTRAADVLATSLGVVDDVLERVLS